MRTALELARTYARIGPASRRDASLFDDVESYCFFIGYPRSGHSLIGSLIDAHPQAVIAQEEAAFRYIDARFDRRRFFYQLEANAWRSAAEGRQLRDYRYAVPGQWQGRHDTIRMIGDKQAAGATIRLGLKPHLLDRLRRTVGVPLRVIHVVRNPFDTITTMATRAADRVARKTGGPRPDPDLGEAAGRFNALSRTVVRLQERLGDAVYELRHERFVADPAGRLRGLCAWLDLPVPDEYLAACASIVWDNPQRTRDREPWPDELRSSVDALIADSPHLSGYAFEEESAGESDVGPSRL